MAYQTRQRDPLLDSSMQEMIEKRGKELFGLGLVILGLLALAMAISYTPSDPSFLSVTDAPVQNWLGQTGASIAAPVFMIVGWGALAFAAGVAAAATTTWDTLTGATINAGKGANVFGSGSGLGPTSTALIFEAGVTGTVTSIDVALSRFIFSTSTASAVFSLYASGGSAPGTLLGSGSVVTATSAAFSPLIQTVSGWGSTLLTAGQTYWLVAAAASPSDQLLWFGTDPEAAGQRAATQDNSSWTVKTDVIPAARITVSPIPLPASGALLIIGLGGLGALGRRRRLSA